MSSIIENNSVVTIHYIVKDQSTGELIDESTKEAPLEYLHGSGMIIPGLEDALTGKKTGEKFEVTVSSEQAYGETSDELIQTVEKSAFGDLDSIEVGMTFEAEMETGELYPITIDQINGEEITINANHPLAGKDLSFDVEVVSVREATKEELEQGFTE